jgi:sterol desaturase/sphingolipid hydroxylase (fatty acid hydroxylase superfamily)
MITDSSSDSPGVGKGGRGALSLKIAAATLLVLACAAYFYRDRLHLPENFTWSPRPEDYDIIAFFGLVAIFEAWERLRPARTIDRWADIKIDVLSFVLAVLMNRVCTKAIKSAAFAILPVSMIGGIHALQSLPGGLKIFLAVVVADFIIYWIHRAQHRTKFLWRTHIWHHSAEQMYWFSGFRTSFLHSFIYNIPQAAVPMLVFGLSPLQAGIGYSIGLLIQFWEHTNVNVNIGPLKYIFITPAYHRVHHSAGRNSNRNLGTTFSLWDRMFGTYIDPATLPDNYRLGLGRTIDKKKIPRMIVGV